MGKLRIFESVTGMVIVLTFYFVFMFTFRWTDNHDLVVDAIDASLSRNYMIEKYMKKKFS